MSREFSERALLTRAQARQTTTSRSHRAFLRANTSCVTSTLPCTPQAPSAARSSTSPVRRSRSRVGAASLLPTLLLSLARTRRRTRVFRSVSRSCRVCEGMRLTREQTSTTRFLLATSTLVRLRLLARWGAYKLCGSRERTTIPCMDFSMRPI